MPTYQYACTSCGEQLEVVQKFSDEPLTECPACKGRLRKVFSPVGVVFKGSGFYKTDSRAKTGKKAAESPAKTDEKSSTGAGTDKPAASSGSTDTKSGSTDTKSGSADSKSGSSSSSGQVA